MKRVKLIKFCYAIIFITCLAFNSTYAQQEAGPTPLPTPTLIPTSKSEASSNDGGVMGKRYSITEIREDFEQFRKFVFRKLLPKPYANQDEIAQAFRNQSELLHDGMNELEFYRVINPIVVKLHCGHTKLKVSPEYQKQLIQNSNLIPCAVKIIKGRAYVYHDLGANIPKGAEILAINGKPIKDILEQISDNISADGFNVTWKVFQMNKSFQTLYFQWVDHSHQFCVSYIDHNTKKQTQVILTAINYAQLSRNYLRFLPRREQDEAGYGKELHSDYAFLKVGTFRFENVIAQIRYKKFICAFFEEVSRRKITNLILDLRDNGGGQSQNAGYLFSYLISKATSYFTLNSNERHFLKYRPVKPAANSFKGNLYVLMNGGSFSATGLLCSLLKYHRIGKLIGEETGGSYICTAGSRLFVLKHTRLGLAKTFRFAQTVVSGLTPGRGVFPDVEVTPAIEDYLSGRDVEKETALQMIQMSPEPLRLQRNLAR